IGKVCHVINNDATPDKLRFVDVEHVIVTREEMAKRGWPKASAAIILDGNEISRIGALRSFLDENQVEVFFIDHHMSHSDLRERYFVDEGASAIGEMLYRFLEWRGEGDLIDYSIALGMYVSILTDTSSFRFSRTTAKSHLIAADLLSRGVDPEAVYQNIYAMHTPSRMSLLGELLSNIHLDCDGQLAWIELTEHLLNLYGTTPEETEGLIDQIMLLKNVELGAFFREDAAGKVKVSLRSKGKIPIHTVAAHFGGGGHKYAAGMTLAGDFREVTDRVVEALRQLLVKSGNSAVQKLTPRR
ncbi:MAG: hypothetical protein HY391_05270, partial [Deltaproteobacteria bacterium]|nr:hypothetical protein [Deltaproteobacteria bacterium]